MPECWPACGRHAESGIPNRKLEGTLWLIHCPNKNPKSEMGLCCCAVKTAVKTAVFVPKAAVKTAVFVHNEKDKRRLNDRLDQIEQGQMSAASD